MSNKEIETLQRKLEENIFAIAAKNREIKRLKEEIEKSKDPNGLKNLEENNNNIKENNEEQNAIINNNNNNDNIRNNEEETKLEEQEQSTNINEENIPYIVEEQEALIANHMDIIKSEAKLLTEEGNLISKIKGITEENYTMDEYVYKIEDIIKTKLKYFQDLKQKIKEYKSLLG